MIISLLLAVLIKGFMIMGLKCHQENSPVECDGYVKYEKTRIDKISSYIENK